MSDETLWAALQAEPSIMAFYTPDQTEPYSVCVGSHGGWGATPEAAMLECLRCCSETEPGDDEPSAGIGGYWQIDYGKGQLLRDWFNELSVEHLGGPLWVGTWLPEDHPLANATSPSQP